MGQRKVTNQSLPPDNKITEQQTRRTHAEIADESGELPELDLHGFTANQASVEVYNYIIAMNAADEPCCRIVHGKGTGTLKQIVEKEIEDLTSQGVVDQHFQS